MALFGPRITGDADVSGIVRTLRTEGLLVTSGTGDDAIQAKQGQVYRFTGTADSTLTVPDVSSGGDIRPGAEFLIINGKSSGAVNVADSGSNRVGTEGIPAGGSALLILVAPPGTGTGIGSWQLIELRQGSAAVTKFTQTFTATSDGTAGGWAAATQDAGNAHTVTFTGSIPADPIINVYQTFASTGTTTVITPHKRVLIDTDYQTSVTGGTTTRSVIISVPALSTVSTTFAGFVTIV